MRTLKKILFGLLGLVLFLIIHKGYIFYKATEVFKYSHKPDISTYKTLTRFPVKEIQLEINSTEKTSLYNLNFKIPKLNEIVYDSLIDKKARIITFSDSTSIITTYDSNIEGLNFIKHVGNIDKNIDEISIKNYLKKHSISSNYELLKYVFNITPDSIRFFDSNEDILVGYTLLRFKEIIMATGSEDYLNNFETEFIKGFQFGNPGLSKIVLLNIFDKKDKQYSILFRGKKITQEIIDYVINNIKTNANNVYN